MGVAATVGLTVAAGLWQGYQAQQQANAQASTMQANANIAYNNAKKIDEQAHEQAQNNAINEENQRRKLRVQEAAAENKVGASGLVMGGSALQTLSDNEYNMAFDMAKQRYNGRTKVDTLMQNSTDYVNQGDVYSKQASEYKSAGRRAMIASLIKTGASVAASLYGAHALAASGSSSSAASSGVVTPYGTLKDNVWVGTIPRSQAVAKGLI